MPRFFEEVWGQIRGIGVGSDPLLVGYMFHMWFVVFLIWYSMLGIPLFLWLRGDRGRRAIGWLGARTRIRGSTLAVAIAVSVALVIGGVDAFLEGWEGPTPYSWAYAAFFSGIAVQAWAWSQAATSFGMRLPAFHRPLPGGVSEAAMPFFVVHQPVIVAVAFVVVGWNASIGIKFVALFTTSLAISAGLAWALSRMPLVSRGVGVKRPAMARS